MRSARYFRAALVAVWLLPFVDLALDAASDGFSRFQDLPSLPPASWLLTATWLLGVVAFFGLIISSAALWVFQRWAIGLRSRTA